MRRSDGRREIEMDADRQNTGIGANPDPGQHEVFAALDAILSSSRVGGAPPLSGAVTRLERALREHFRSEEQTLVASVGGGASPRARTHRSILNYVSRLGSHLDQWDAAQAHLHLRFLDHLLTTHLCDLN